MTPLESLIATGTKLWLDSIDPDLVRANHKLGATGATSNPVIVSNLLNSGRFDDEIQQFLQTGHDDNEIAWRLTDMLVRDAQQVFHPIWEHTQGNDGYVSFELDPLLEDTDQNLPHEDRVARYIELGKQWSAGHDNRMIKVPATPAGLAALEELAAAGVTLNVTLIFTMSQYTSARDAIWRGAVRLGDLTSLKSVYSIFVSRIDVYTQKHVPELSPAAQGMMGIVNAKRIWQANQSFWSAHTMPLQQEIVFASTGTKDPNMAPWKYVEAFAGSDIETNPPATNDAIQESNMRFTARIKEMPQEELLGEIDRTVDMDELETVLMDEGIQKFADPQKALLALIAEQRQLRIAG
jgi:transaldolase